MKNVVFSLFKVPLEGTTVYFMVNLAPRSLVQETVGREGQRRERERDKPCLA